MSKARLSNGELVRLALAHMGRRKAPATVSRYTDVYGPFLEWLAGDSERKPTAIGDVTLADLNAYADRPWLTRRGTPPEPATRKMEVMALRALFRVLHDQLELLDRNPSVGLEAPDVDNENPNPIADEVWKPLWASDLPDHERVAYGLARFVTLRRQEVTRLGPWQFVDVPTTRINAVVRKGGKTQNMPWRSAVEWFETTRPDLGAYLLAEALERLLPTRSGCLALLPWADARKLQYIERTIHKRPEGFVNPDIYNNRLARALERSGQPADAATPHMLRAACCTDLIDTGMPMPKVTRLMGHSSPIVTMRYIKTGDDPFVDELKKRAADEPVGRVSRWA